MNYMADLFTIALVVVLAYLGYRKGFMSKGASILGSIFGSLVAFLVSKPLAFSFYSTKVYPKLHEDIITYSLENINDSITAGVKTLSDTTDVNSLSESLRNSILDVLKQGAEAGEALKQNVATGIANEMLDVLSPIVILGIRIILFILIFIVLSIVISVILGLVIKVVYEIPFVKEADKLLGAISGGVVGFIYGVVITCIMILPSLISAFGGNEIETGGFMINFMLKII